MASRHRGWAGTVLHNSLMLLVARAASALAGVLTLPVLYNRLGPRTYGAWALCGGMVAIAALADLGLGSAQIRGVALAVGGGDARHARAVLALGRVGCTGLTVVALVLVAACWRWLAGAFRLGSLAGPTRVAVLLLLTAALVDGFALPWRAVLEGTQHYRPVGLVTGGAAVACAALSALAVTAGGGLVWLGVAAVLSSAGQAVAFRVTAARWSAQLAPRLRDVRRSDLTAVLGYGGRMQLSNVSAAVNTEADRLVLGRFLATTTVGDFDLGCKLANALRLVPSLVLTPLFPAAGAVAARARPGELDRLYLRATRYLAAFAAVGGAALVVSADPLVRLWVGHPVPLAVITIELLVPGYAVNLAAGAAAVVTRAEGQPGRETRYALLAAGLNVVTTVPLLRLFGPGGVPLSTSIAAGVSTVYFFVHFHRRSHRPIRPLLGALGPAVAAGVTAGIAAALVEPALPNGAGRWAAAEAVACRGGVATAAGVVVLAAVCVFGRISASKRARSLPDRCTVEEGRCR